MLYSQSAKDDHWRHVMVEEYNALIYNETCELISLSSSQNVIGCRWVFMTKLKFDRSLDHHKTHLIAKGDHYILG